MPQHPDKLPLGAEVIAEYEVAEDEERREPLQAIVRGAVEEARKWREENLEPEQEKATDYYHSREFGNEVEGRSRVVTSEVRDVVKAILPSILRVFFGPERVVEFKPQQPHEQPLAEQQTDYINHVLREDNKGFLVLHSAWKDALIRKLGVVTWWWDDTPRTEGATYSGLTREQLLVLESVPGGEVEVIEVTEAVTEEMPDGSVMMIEPEQFEVEFTRVVENGRARIAAVPPEEFVFSPNARSLEDARMVGRIREIPASEAREMGVDKDLIERAMGRTEIYDGLPDARRIDGGATVGHEDEQDPVTRPVQFADLYMMLENPDRPGTASLRHIQAIGDGYHIVSNVAAEEKPFALFTPDPEPHTIIGRCSADDVMDLQRIGSSVLRGMLDSLSQSLNPSTEVVEGEVNMKDLLNQEVGRIVRARKPGMMREVTTPFVGADALPVMQWLGEVKENRTGISKAAAGLDADALQSSTKAAVAATLSGAQQQIEMVARVFAETGMTDLFKGILRLVVRNQDRPRVINLRGEYVEVDPRSWDADLDVVVNVALGAGLTEDRMQLLAMIVDKQEQQLLNGSPLVGLHEYRNTLGRLVELGGFKNSAEFFRPWTAEQDQELEQQRAESADEPDAQTKALVQVEMAKLQQEMQKVQATMQEAQEKLQARLQEENAKLQVKIQEMQMTDAREREKMAQDFAIKQAALRAKYAVDVDDQELKRARLGLERERSEVDAALRGIETGLEISNLEADTQE